MSHFEKITLDPFSSEPEDGTVDFEDIEDTDSIGYDGSNFEQLGQVDIGWMAPEFRVFGAAEANDANVAPFIDTGVHDFSELVAHDFLELVPDDSFNATVISFLILVGEISGKFESFRVMTDSSCEQCGSSRSSSTVFTEGKDDSCKFKEKCILDNLTT